MHAVPRTVLRPSACAEVAVAELINIAKFAFEKHVDGLIATVGPNNRHVSHEAIALHVASLMVEVSVGFDLAIGEDEVYGFVFAKGIDVVILRKADVGQVDVAELHVAEVEVGQREVHAASRFALIEVDGSVHSGLFVVILFAKSDIEVAIVDSFHGANVSGLRHSHNRRGSKGADE